MDIHDELDTYKNKLDNSKFNISVFTDGHYDIRDTYFAEMNSNYTTGRLSDSYMQQFIDVLDGFTDVLHLNGDNINGVIDNQRSGMAQNQYILRKWFTGKNKSYRSAIIGNHDDLSPIGILKGNATSTSISDVIDESWFRANIPQEPSTHYDNDSLSFYKDFDAYKIRLIALDTEEPPTTLDRNGHVLYPRWVWHGLTNKTLFWLSYKALMGVPSDYTTLIVTHCPLWFSDGLDYQWNDTGSRMINFDVLRELLNGFITGQSVSINKSDKSIHDWLDPLPVTRRNELYGVGWGVKLNIDFSKQGNRSFIGVFSGHTHKEAIADLGTFKNIQLQHGFPNSQSGLPGLTTISIDTSSRLVNLVGFGIATDRSFKY
ncbi:hypothetical protein [Levilactobacillus bambusae]|uniref:Calcineurin-like phosphoesterase domain-containing protein n=1 Tax=Levilactobacillus bambusae TaxID=2024736 RepID=A0A2V1N019_9LACO|nr:hypothetical protein [Levilactobacillus bambusae]PWF99764.1 hypothetical protein DCM90_06800 [Levilactobacillus bambusae]